MTENPMEKILGAYADIEMKLDFSRTVFIAIEKYAQEHSMSRIDVMAGLAATFSSLFKMQAKSEEEFISMMQTFKEFLDRSVVIFNRHDREIKDKLEKDRRVNND